MINNNYILATIKIGKFIDKSMKKGITPSKLEQSLNQKYSEEPLQKLLGVCLTEKSILNTVKKHYLIKQSYPRLKVNMAILSDFSNRINWLKNYHFSHKKSFLRSCNQMMKYVGKPLSLQCLKYKLKGN